MTNGFSPEKGISNKLLAAPGVKFRLAALCLVILAAGAYMAPARAPALSAPQEHAAPLLEEQVQATAVPIQFRGLEEIARQVRQDSVAIAPRREQLPATWSDFDDPMPRSEASGFGVFLSDGFVLTHADALDGRTVVQISASDGAITDGQVAAYEPSTQIVLLRTQTSKTTSVPLAARAPAAGTLTVAVGRWSGRDISVPVFVVSAGDDRYTLTDAGGALRSGMPLFTLDGELLAIVGREEGATHAFAVREAAARLVASASRGGPLASFGVTVQEPVGSATGIAGTTGVLISKVVEGGPASDADLRVGDLLLAVGTTEIDSAENTARVLQSVEPGVPTALRVLRNGRVRTIRVTASTAYEVASIARAGSATSSDLPEARLLFTSSQLEASRIPASARVLSAGGRRVSSRAQLQRQLRATKQPMLVLLEHGDHQFFASIAQSQ